MIIGQTIFAGTFYSQWFPRQGNAAVFSGEMIAHSGSGTLTIVVETKNLSDTDVSGTLVGGTVQWTSLDDTTKATSGAATGAKELVRFKYVFAASANGWTHFRVLAPAWCPN